MRTAEPPRKKSKEARVVGGIVTGVAFLAGVLMVVLRVTNMYRAVVCPFFFSGVVVLFWGQNEALVVLYDEECFRIRGEDIYGVQERGEKDSVKKTGRWRWIRNVLEREGEDGGVRKVRSLVVAQGIWAGVLASVPFLVLLLFVPCRNF